MIGGNLCSSGEFEFRRQIQEIKKAGGICPGCAHKDNCPNPNYYENRITIACVWHEKEGEKKE